MSYVGSSAAVIPVGFSGVNSQSFNGDGSTVAFTLNRPVSAVNAIEVMVNNVQQSPYDSSYSVSDTTLTFSAAPSSGTANIYVVYRDFPVGSITDPNTYTKAQTYTKDQTDTLLDARVAKTGDTMTGDLTLPTIVLPSGGSLAVKDSSNVDTYIGVDSAGRVTMPYQPAFFARPSSDPTNGVVVCNLVDFNVGSHYNSSNGRFTAPVSGIYYFSAITNGGAGTGAIALRFRKNETTVPGFQAYIQDVDDSPNISGIMSLTAGDYIDLVTDVTSIASTPWTHFCGHLIG